MNEADVAKRIYDNLSWARAAGGDSRDAGPFGPSHVWAQVQAVWQAPDRQFVQGLYLAIVFRPADRAGLAQWCGALSGGMSRADLVRALVRSDEARRCQTNLSWLPELDKLAPPRRRAFPLRPLAAFLRGLMRPGAAWAKFKAGAARRFGPRPAPPSKGDS